MPLSKTKRPNTHYSLCQKEANYAPITATITRRRDAKAHNSHLNPLMLAPPCGSVAKIGREDVENATRAPLVSFGSVFSLILGLV